MSRKILCIVLAIIAEAPALARAGRFDLVPEPDVRQTTTNRVTSAYVVDKKASEFWICTVRYQYRDLTANNGECVKLAAEIGRPALTETYELHAVNGSSVIGPLLPVFWFIDPASGAVQFCAVRHAGLCVQMSLP